MMLIFATMALGCVVLAAVCDVRRFEIPDEFSIALVVLFIMFAAIAEPSVDWIGHILIGAVVFGFGTALFIRSWMGGGDVKLLAACALWAGPAGLTSLLFGMAISGGLLAASALVARRLVSPDHPYPALRHGGPIPYAVAILGGVAWLVINTARAGNS